MSFQSHEEKKQQLISQLKNFIVDKNSHLSLHKRRSNLFRSNDRKGNRLDVRSFDQVLVIDKEQLIADVEGMCTYEKLVHETLKYGCLPTVVPELKSITIGGALSGCGIESSSFRYGLVHETISETEVLLSDGQVITCCPNENGRLFSAFPNSYGTLGYALKVKVQLVPAKKFVRLTHYRFSESKLFFATLTTLCHENKQKGSVSYIDGVIFAENEMYITTGEPVDQAPYVTNYKYLNIYYRSIRTKKEDYLTTEDYIWRWDTDWFWCSKVFFMQNYLMRLLFGKLMLTSKVYTKIMNYVHRHPMLSSCIECFQPKREPVIQDVLIPINKATEFLAFFQQEIGIKPIWVCPVSSFSKAAKYALCPLNPDLLYVDFGFWDSLPTEKEDGFYNRKIEKHVQALQGFKSLYSTSYYNEDEFWKLYDKAEYSDLKKKYDPQGILGDIFKKCSASKET